MSARLVVSTAIPLHVLVRATAALKRVMDMNCGEPLPADIWTEVMHAHSHMHVRVNNILANIEVPVDTGASV